MNRDAVGAVAESLGAFGAIGSVLYLAYEVQSVPPSLLKGRLFREIDGVSLGKLIAAPRDRLLTHCNADGHQ